MNQTLAHFLVRLIVIPIVYFVIFYLITDGETDQYNAGIGFGFALMAMLPISIIFFGAEAYLLSKKKLKDKATIDIVLLSLTVTTILILLANT